jgi:hypothetical protein
MKTNMNEHLKVDKSHLIQNKDYLKDLLGGRSLKRMPDKLEICNKTLKAINKISKKRELSTAEVVWRLLQICDIVDDTLLESAMDFKMANFQKTTLEVTPTAVKKFSKAAAKYNVEIFVLLHVCTELLISNMKHADEYEYKVIEYLISQVEDVVVNCDHIYNSFNKRLGYYPPGVETALVESSEHLFEVSRELQYYLDGKGWSPEQLATTEFEQPIK